jgi:hypothetical protein
VRATRAPTRQQPLSMDGAGRRFHSRKKENAGKAGVFVNFD